MRDASALRKRPPPIYNEDARVRCAICGALPRVGWRHLGGGRIVDTCESEYCKARGYAMVCVESFERTSPLDHPLPVKGSK